VVVPIRVEAEVAEHLEVLFDGLVQSGEIIAHHQGARAGHENESLRVTQVHSSPPRDHDFLTRQDKTKAGDGLENLQRRQGRIVFERRAFDRVEDVDRNDIGADFF
jgi:hypothetical protein